MAELALGRQESVARPLERRLAAHRSVAWVHGLVGGLVSGVVMGLFLMIVMWIGRNAFFPGRLFRPLELIGSLWCGTITNGASAALLGAVTLLGSSVILGLIWAYAFSYVKVEPLVSGVAFGAILWAIMQYAVVPGVGGFILGRAADYLREDYVQHNPDVPQGRSGFVQFFEQTFTAMPDFAYELLNIAADGAFVWSYSRTTGTHSHGTWLGIAPSDNRLDFAVVDIFRVEDGKIAEHWDVADTLSLFVQLGKVTL
jgi:predicted SnoaL-like aldol condensation-catalyzing enzyme